MSSAAKAPTQPRNPHVETDNSLWFCPECCWPLDKVVGVGFFYHYGDDTEPQRHDGKWVDCGKPYHPHDARNPLAHSVSPRDAAPRQLALFEATP